MDLDTAFNPLGPIFISYRVADGAEFARLMARALRCAGAPVWHDQDDLPPGDTRHRLQEALTRGLSGAVLVVTPGIQESSVVKEIEFPKLRKLQEEYPDFVFVVASTVEAAGKAGHLDFDAPDRFLSMPPNTLRTVKQYPLLEAGACERIAERIVRQRMDVHRRLGEETLTIDIQTRQEAQAFTNQTALVVRTPPPKESFRSPSPETWPPLRSFLAALPSLVEASGAKKVVLKGGAHLTAAFSLGAALPTTCRWALAVEDQNQTLWEDTGSGAPPDLNLQEAGLGTPRSPVAVWVDLVPTPPPTDAFRDFLAGREAQFSASLRIQPGQPHMLAPAEIGEVVREIASAIRKFASRHDTSEVHLFLRTSFPAAVLLGRLFNTLRVTLYELEHRAERPQYLPMVTVSSGRGGGPIVTIDC